MRFAIAILVLAVGCQANVGVHRKLKPEQVAAADAWKGVARIAVMPPDNWTTDVGLEYITWYRAVVNELVREKGYEVASLAEVNRFFRKNKFSVAGEAGIYSAADLTKQFGVDAILYWAITAGGPRMMFLLEKGDGTALWSTGDVGLALGYVAPVRGGFNSDDKEIALALGEILRALPPRTP
ncbi:MAG TPA: GNA1162 family protein [Planctomycetota bacterium]|nr:GNA1162 family protein [Planctomycetota bacterium]